MGDFIKVGEIRVSLLWINTAAILVSIPIVIVFIRGEIVLFGVPRMHWWELFCFLAGFCIQAFTHELLHGFGYSVDGGLRWSQLKFGVNWKALAPYCICLSPVAMPPFRRTALLPTVILFPLCVGIWLAFGTWWLNLLAATALMAGIGDFIVVIKSLKYPRSLFIVEHAKGAGGDLFISAHEQNQQTNRP